MAAYEDAVAALHRAPFADFVVERKRLAQQLKAGGDKESAARLSKLPRPPVSAWAVNQLWWRAQGEVEQLFAVAARVKSGDRDASKAHREQLSRLRERATELLQEAGNAATEPTLRRVTTTLSAIAAQGGFAPDTPGALSADRDPPGFETLGFAATAPPPRVEESEAAADAERARRLEAERRRAEEEERERRQAERERVSHALRDARTRESSQLRDRARLQEALAAAEQVLSETQDLVERLERELVSL